MDFKLPGASTAINALFILSYFPALMLPSQWTLCLSVCVRGGGGGSHAGPLKVRDHLLYSLTWGSIRKLGQFGPFVPNLSQDGWWFCPYRLDVS